MKFADDHTKDLGKNAGLPDANILLLEDLLKAINAPESGLVPEAILQPSDQDDGRAREIARQIANWQSPPPASKQEPRSLKPVAKVIAILCLATGAVFLPATIARLMSKQALVRPTPVRVAEHVSEPMAQETPAGARQAQLLTKQPSKPAVDTAEAAGSIDPVRASPKVQESFSTMVQPDGPTQPPPAVSSNTDTLPNADRLTAPVEAAALVAPTPEPQPSAPPPPAAIGQLDTSALFDQYLKWKSNHHKPQVQQQQKVLHSAKPAAKPSTSPLHHTVVKNTGNKTAPAPSQIKDESSDPAPPALEETDDKS
jgi:hypothetical protein